MNDRFHVCRFSIIIALVLMCLFSGGCSLFSPLPPPIKTVQRLSQMPLQGIPVQSPVEIRWNEYQVPYIYADHDDDAAFALGMVHAHLRLAQMEVGKRISQGRLSEMGGPFFTEIDEALRILGFGRAAEKVLAGMPKDSRRWLDRYVEGVNFYKDSLKSAELPHVYTVMNLSREPWTAADTITLGRLGGTDVNWLTIFSLLNLRDSPEWQVTWEKVLSTGSHGETSFTLDAPDGDERVAFLKDLLRGWGKVGSNSMVVAGHKSSTGSALIASDPHLGITLPNIWLIAGLQCPTYHLVGMSAPGTPVFAFGRNEDIAWGGTNLRALGTDIVDVSDLPAEAFQEEQHEIAVRFWFDETVKSRMSPYGPVISDASYVPKPDGKDLALRWVGHSFSDEITAMLRAGRAKDWQSFVEALEEFSVPAQNFMYADTHGNIGHVLAAQLPKRSGEKPGDVYIDTALSDKNWETILGTLTLPRILNPAEGYLASANNKPVDTEYPISWFYGPDERIRRLKQMLSAEKVFTPADLKAMQHDTVSLTSLELRDALLAGVDVDVAGEAAEVLTSLKSWDGRYEADSRGALCFEAVLTIFAPKMYEALESSELFETIKNRGWVRHLILEDLAELDTAALQNESASRSALLKATLEECVEALDGKKVWGDVHRLELNTWLARAPIVGKKYAFGSYPAGGSRDTVMKTAHPFTVEPHGTFYGSQARHVSDMADPDANWFVLLGGQDERMTSSDFINQVELWRKGEYIRVPLSRELVEKSFPYTTVLRPAP
jgi:penicillin amidase